MLKLVKQIGVEVEKGKLLDFSGISASNMKAYFHDIRIDVGGYEFDCYAGFSKDLDRLPYGVLGQQGFFDLFILMFDYSKERVELKPKNNVHAD